MKRINTEYRIELVFIVLGLIGGLLLVIEPEDLKLFFQATSQTLTSAKAGFPATAERLLEYLSGYSIYEIIGLVLVISALIVITQRIRFRYAKSTQWDATSCPKCGSELHRVHRSLFDRILGKTFMPGARRYRCANHNCGWTGLRHRRAHSHSSHISDTATEI